MKPSKELESPFLVKQRPIVWSYSSILDDLYRFTTTLDDLYRFTTTLLDSSESLQEVWVSSEVPFVIKLKLAHIQEAVKEGGKLDSDCLNLAIRNMAAEDAENYKNKKCLGWRRYAHYIDSDWTESVVRGLDHWNTTYLKNVFSRQSILYNASDSHLVLIPVIWNEHWTLYAFNMSDRKLNILDSLPDSTQGGLDPEERHKQIRPEVCGLLNLTMDTAFDMSEKDFRNWKYEFPKVPRQQNSCDCGFFMFNFMRLWDGHQLVQSFPTESRELRKHFLAYILSCKDNQAKLPPLVSRWITNLSEEAKLARKDRQSWARYPMDKRLLKAARESDVEAFKKLVVQGRRQPEVQPQAQPSAKKKLRSLLSIATVKCIEFFSWISGHYPGGPRPSSASVVGYVEGQEQGAGTTSSHDDVTAAEQVDEVGGQGAADERAIDIGPPEPEANEIQASAIAKGASAAAGMNQRTETNSIPPYMLLHGASSDGDGVLHIAASHGHVELTRVVFHALGIKLPAEPEKKKKATSCALWGLCQRSRANKKEGATTVSGAASTVASHPMPSSADDATNGEAGQTTRTVLVSEFLRARNHKGETCLHEAVRCGHKELVRLLVLADASLDDDETSPALVQIADDEGVSPLYLASTLRRADIVGVLTDKQRCRYSPSYSGPGRKTALHAAVLLNKELTEQLLKWNKDLINAADESGSTPLHFVASAGHEIIAKLLLEKDSDSAYCADAEGSLPIHVAGAEGRLDIIKQLLQACPDCIWSLDSSGRSFLHAAVEKRQAKVVAYVCKKKWPLLRRARFFNIRDKEGNTALHLAVRNGNQSAFCSLIRKNEVHLSLTNKEGHTPLDLAELSIPSGLRYLQASREWILYDLLLAGADFGVCRWDHFTSKITEPDKEKHSEEISKSAGLGAVCAVLILTVAFAAPFNVAKSYLGSSSGASDQASSRSNKSRASQHVFGAFIIFDAMAFVHSALATCCCTFAGFPIVDYSRARFLFLREAWRCLRYAALCMVVVFMLGVYLVVAPVDVKAAIFACVLALLAIIPHGTAVPIMLTHAVALCRRLGFLRWLRSVFQGNTVRLRNRRPPYYRYPPLHLGSWLVVIGYLVSCGILAVDSAF